VRFDAHYIPVRATFENEIAGGGLDRLRKIIFKLGSSFAARASAFSAAYLYAYTKCLLRRARVGTISSFNVFLFTIFSNFLKPGIIPIPSSRYLIIISYPHTAPYAGR